MVEVCGVKYLEGVGKKSGQPYRAFQIYYTKSGKASGVSGYITGEAWVDCALLNGRVINVGDKLFLSRNDKGYLESVEFAQ